ncbi:MULTISPECIES: alpha/beta hydrolase [unclassified Paenibacillus]|uniref:alpha/beta fold hydrolase n=1 Tax=unclassified Paenibacillus TaxID=185978 RepID=UPI001AE17CC4|nr:MULTISPECIES: alpha/beta hydrolase [unclassified Paenibacillus]MBP1153815.1 pimeloyl-ACP methyl ester carboxylesterase [Paenibacillus sp. PvP091]MBP1170800.1 pimeloyl-ACP methyl ester carboxylesterase [Paenibacillus sp. PvR098]MBP2441828.1 pimeloyl-ACP methyl ester carboxylesterase [Paenibacillus sp. PvP052]
MPYADINGTKLYYQLKGQGVPILFLHPPLMTGHTFAYQQHQLADHYQVITFDIRGHGQSPYSKEPITYPLIAEDIRQLLDVLGIRKAYLCGYSTGGSIALEAMLNYPERFLGGILVSALSEVSSPVLKTEIWLASALSAAGAKRLLAAAITAGNADSLQTFKQLYRSSIQGDIRNLHQYYRFSSKYNCTKHLKEIRAPILLLYGQKDKRFKRYVRILQKHLPISSLYILGNATHQIPTKEAKRMNDIIRMWVTRQQEGISHNRSLRPDMELPHLAEAMLPVAEQEETHI